MTRHDCGVRPEELILFADGALKGAKGELVEAHLRACPLCRRWMAEFEETGRLIRAASPPIDDPAGRATLRARIEREALRGQRSRSLHPLFIIAGALVLVLGTVLVVPASSSEARVGVGRFFRFIERGAQRSALTGGATPVAASLPTPQPMSPEGLAALPFTPQIPAELPQGLRLSGGRIIRGTRLELRYRNDRGLVLALTQERAQDANYTLTTSNGRLVTIGGVEAVWQPAPPPDTVAVLTWEDRGILYSLSTDEIPDGPLSFAAARQIVEALLAGP